MTTITDGKITVQVDMRIFDLLLNAEKGAYDFAQYCREKLKEAKLESREDCYMMYKKSIEKVSKDADMLIHLLEEVNKQKNAIKEN